MTTIKALTDWLARRSPRERASVAVLGAVTALATCLSMLDAVVSARGLVGERQVALVDAEAGAERDSNAAFQRQVSEEVNKVWRWSVVDSSEGLVRAQALTLFETLAAEAGFIAPEINLEESEQRTETVGVVHARLTAGSDWSNLNALLGAIANADESIVIERIEVRGDEASEGSLVVDLVVPFVIEANP